MQVATIVGTPYIILAVLLFVIVVAAGIMVVTFLVERKWGYTPEREQELEEQSEQNNEH